MSPRRRNDLTPADTTGTPTDGMPASRDTPAPLPKPPAGPVGKSLGRPPASPSGSRPAAPAAKPAGTNPPAVRPPRLPDPGEAGARPGRRSDTPSDMQMTKRIPRLPGRGDVTPAPLPPSPGAGDAERWFEQVPTNPAHAGELAENTGGHRKARPSSRLPVRDVPARSGLVERPWLLTTLIAAIALTIGMILGGLLFGGGKDECKPCDDANGSGTEPAAHTP